MIALLSAAIAGFLGLLLLPLWLHHVIAAYGLGDAAGGYIAAAEFSAVALSSYVVSARMRADGSVAALAIGFAAIVAGNLVSAVPDVLALLVAARALVGLGAGIVLAHVHARAAQTARPDGTFGTISFCTILTGVILYPLLGEVAGHGAPAIFIVMGATAALCGVVTFLRMPAPSERVTPPDVSTLSAATASPDGRRAALGALAFYIAEGTLWAYVIRLSVVAGVTATEASRLLSGTLALGLAGAAMASAVSRRFGRTLPMIIALSGLAVVGWSLGNVHDARAYSTAVVSFNLLFVFAVIYSSGLLADLDPSGRLAARIPTFRTIGNAAGPFLGAALVGVSDYGTFGIAVAVLYATSATLLFGPARRADRNLFTID